MKLKEAANNYDSRIWNTWKVGTGKIVFDNIDFYNISNSPFREYEFVGVCFINCLFAKADFDACLFDGAEFECEIKETTFVKCSFEGATFRKSRITNANFTKSNFNGAKFLECKLNNINLYGASFIFSTFDGGEICNCNAYGVNTWDINFINAPLQHNLKVESYAQERIRGEKGVVSVDNIELAQFINLLLSNSKVNSFINVTSSKIVLILGRFTPERKRILNALADEAHKSGLVPIIFDFEKPTTRTFTETIKILAGISLFVIADVTSPKASPLELQALVPDYQCPFITILQEGERPFSMLVDLARAYEWVSKTVLIYSTEQGIHDKFKSKIYDEAMRIHSTIQQRKNLPPQIERI